MGAGEAYQGHRLLEAMRHATRYADAIFSRMRPFASSHGNVLDFGAGDGVFFDKFKSSGIAVDCMEPDPQLRASLQGRGASSFANLSDLPTDHYDFVYSINVLEHVDALEPTLCGLRRSMRPGATFFVFVPAFDVLWTSLDDEVGHIQRFTKRTLRANLSSAGFEVAEMRYFDSIGFPAAFTVRCLEQLRLFRYSKGSVSFYDRYLVRPSLLLDRWSGHRFGKNLIAVARNPKVL